MLSAVLADLRVATWTLRATEAKYGRRSAGAKCRRKATIRP